jgi:hypothetical protein
MNAPRLPNAPMPVDEVMIWSERASAAALLGPAPGPASAEAG